MGAISLDFETFSSADIDVGSYKYAEDPSTEVLVLGLQDLSTSEVLTWDIRQPHNAAVELLHRAITEGWEIHAFNSQFEWCILKYVCPRQFGFPVPDINKMRCTAAVCRSAGLPASLGACADFLKLPIKKDKIGSKLIRLFSIPQKSGERLTPDSEGLVTVLGERMTYAEAFQKFVDYCAQDVRTEIAIGEKMKSYRLDGFRLEWFLLDARLNDRGVPVDIPALQEAYRMYREQEAALVEKFRSITGYMPSQTLRVTEWLQQRGYAQPKLNKECKAKAKNDPLTDEARLALKIKSQLDYAAIKKIPSMLQMAMEDSKIRGSFTWCGAQKTGRWTSRTPQWQNMVKPPKWLRPMVEDAYQTVRNEKLPLDIFDFVYGPVYHVIACLSRYFVRLPSMSLLDLDFASVEARILPFLIECDRIMDKIRTGADIYEATGAALGAALKAKYDVPFAITRDDAKTIVLATQFQGGHSAVFNATGKAWKREWCDTAVEIVRTENPEFPVAWKKFQDTFLEAFNRPHKWFPATKYVSFAYDRDKGPFPRMLMKLPSGRCITYPHPQCDPITMAKVVQKGAAPKWVRVAGHLEDETIIAGKAGIRPPADIENWFHTHELSFYGHIEGKLYGRVGTYGGDLLQSCFTSDTPVLTARGWVPIAEVTELDRVWDGENWVKTEGVIRQGTRQVVNFEGIQCTPDHLFMVDNSWIPATSITHAQAASQSQKLAGGAFWRTYSHLLSPRWKTDKLGRQVRLRSGEDSMRQRPCKVCEERSGSSLHQNVPLQRVQRQPHWARTVHSPNLLSIRLNDGPVLSEILRVVPMLRSAWDKGVQALAKTREFLQRHAPGISERFATGPDRRERGLLSRELQVGDGERASPQPQELSFYDNPEGADDSSRSVRTIRGEIHHGVRAQEKRVARRQVVGTAEVYDLVNCGPRHRFTVWTANGPMIAHNCTQGTGADLLAYGALRAEEAGFEPFLLVHDQAIAPATGSPEDFEKAMCTIPPWFEGFPLEAEAEIVRSYCKN